MSKIRNAYSLGFDMSLLNWIDELKLALLYVVINENGLKFEYLSHENYLLHRIKQFY